MTDEQLCALVMALILSSGGGYDSVAIENAKAIARQIINSAKGA